MVKYITAFLLIPLILEAYDEQLFNADTIQVTATRTPLESQKNTRMISVIDLTANNSGIGRTVDELLYTNGLIDMQARQMNAQSDLSMRGSSFEQVLVLIDGCPVNNAQTGHHTFHIPLDKDAIERIEIMPGHSSSLYGSSGFGGTIYVITKDSLPRVTNATITIGSFNTIQTGFSTNYRLRKVGIHLSLNKSTSDGFTYDRDYDNLQGDCLINIKLSRNASLNTHTGYLKNEYGAFDFYTPGNGYPSWERIKMFFTYSALNYQTKKTLLTIKAHYNNTYNTFYLVREEPQFYENNHRLNTYGLDAMLGYTLYNNLSLNFYGNLIDESINSSNLGNHRRGRIALGSQLLFHPDHYGMDLSARQDLTFTEDHNLSANFGVYYWLSKSIKLRGTVGTAFRLPSFTELYYSDPINKGNSSLKSEESFNSEAGFDYYHANFNASGTLFQRNARFLIDWIQLGDEWHIGNINEAVFRGIEGEMRQSLMGEFKVHANLQYTTVSTDENYSSKYGLNHARTVVRVSLDFPVGSLMNASFILMNKQRKQTNYSLIDMLFQKSFSRYFTMEFRVINLLNTHYEDIPGVAQPGRAFYVDLAFRHFHDK